MSHTLGRCGIVLRVGAVLALVAAGMVIPAQAVTPPTCWACIPVENGFECKEATSGQQGHTGTCTANRDGCRWSLGEPCTGID